MGKSFGSDDHVVGYAHLTRRVMMILMHVGGWVEVV